MRASTLTRNTFLQRPGHVAMLWACRALRRLIALVVLLAWVGLVGCSEPGFDGANTGQAGEPVVAGLDAQEPELVGFLQSLQRSAQSSPKSGSIRGHLGMAYDVNGFYRAAAATYTQAAALDSEEFRWPYYRAIALARVGRTPDALDSINRAIAMHAGYAPAWLSRGAWLLELDLHQQAADAFQRVTKLEVDSMTRAAATVGMSRTLLRQSRPQEAAGLLEQLATTVTHPYIRQLLGDAYRRLGRLEEAQKITQNGPTDPLKWPDPLQQLKFGFIRGFSGKMLIAKQLLNDNKPIDAIRILESLRQTNPQDRDLLNNLSIAYKLTDQQQKAQAVLQSGLELHPDFHAFHFNIAVLYEDLGDDQLALTHLNRAIELDPGLVEAHRRRIDLLMRREQLHAALMALEEFIRHGPAESGTLLSAGMVAGALEQWPLATERFEQALTLDPSLKRIHLFLGLSLAEAGRFREAKDALRQARRMGVDAADLASARQRLDRLERGIR